MFLAGMFLFVPSDTFAVGCIVQPQNAPQKNEVRNAISVYGVRHTSRIRTAHLSTMTRSACAVNCRSMQQRCVDCGHICLRMQIRSNCWIRGLTANGFFLFRGRDVAITMNSIKILHAVRSSITAIAELLVLKAKWANQHRIHR